MEIFDQNHHSSEIFFTKMARLDKKQMGSHIQWILFMMFFIENIQKFGIRT